MSYKTKDLSEVDFSDIDELLSKLTPEEIEILNGEVDPDVNLSSAYYSFLMCACLDYLTKKWRTESKNNCNCITNHSGSHSPFLTNYYLDIARLLFNYILI